MKMHEFFYQDLINQSGDTADMQKYEVGMYDVVSTSYNYDAAAPYTEKTDIGLTIFTNSGIADTVTYYVEIALTDATKTNP